MRVVGCRNSRSKTLGQFRCAVVVDRSPCEVRTLFSTGQVRVKKLCMFFVRSVLRGIASTVNHLRFRSSRCLPESCVLPLPPAGKSPSAVAAAAAAAAAAAEDAVASAHVPSPASEYYINRYNVNISS
ncbi:Protein of unknown function [Gryllus bimaculatus]|nr:Protein of unknown function [Gryllus bimaculatus]